MSERRKERFEKRGLTRKGLSERRRIGYWNTAVKIVNDKAKKREDIKLIAKQEREKGKL